jgi:hypothetical protein
MQFVEPSARKTERVIVSFMIGREDRRAKTCSFLELGPPFLFISRLKPPLVPQDAAAVKLPRFDVQKMPRGPHILGDLSRLLHGIS